MRVTTRSGATGVEAGVAREAYDHHGAELYRFARRWTGEHAAAEDLVQDVMVQAWRRAALFSPERGSLRTWLFAIARNVAVDHFRRSAARARVTLAARATAPVDQEAAVDSVLLADEVARALVTLSEDHRVAIVETYLRDRSYAEVADELGIPVSTLRSRVFHGLRAMRSAMMGEEASR